MSTCSLKSTLYSLWKREIIEETMIAVSWGEDTKTGVKGWFEKEEKIEKRKEYYKKKKLEGKEKCNCNLFLEQQTLTKRREH